MRCVAAFLAVIFLTSCSGGDGGSPTAPVTASTPASIHVASRPGTILIGDSLILSATASDGSGRPMPGVTITWWSSDTLVARVNSGGILMGVTPGPVAIVAALGAAYGSASTSFSVTVIPDSITGISLSQTPAVLKQSSALLLQPTFLGRNGLPMSQAAQNWARMSSAIAFSFSSASSYVTVGADNILVAVKPGVAEITVRGGEYSASKAITIQATPVPIFVLADGALTVVQKLALYKAVARWAAVFSGSLPAGEVVSVGAGSCDGVPGGSYNTADGITIAADIINRPGVAATGGPCVTRSKSADGYKTGLTVIGGVSLSTANPASTLNDSQLLYRLWSHEIGHALGLIRSYPGDTLVNTYGGVDPRWRGVEAVRQYVLLGGSTQGVPINGTHWRNSGIEADVMSSGSGSLTASVLSAVSVGALKDLGYPADPARAEPFMAPPVINSP